VNDSGSCPMAGFSNSNVEPSSESTKQLTSATEGQKYTYY